ncbi:MAG: amidohydrolase [Bacteroidota bacterium]|nr:amidohydrolase [Bacteroidota bacterium]
MNQDLKISIIQSDLFWEDTRKNLKQFEQQLELLEEETDLIVLPEMFNTGFAMSPLRIAEAMDGPTVEWLARKANENNCVVTGSMAISEGGRFYNRLIWMKPDGTFQYYDKRHLFRMGNEQQFYTGGKQKMITEIKGWKICPLICYDLRFPVWSRNRYKDREYEYDLLIYVANWPASRAMVWKSLLVARALENMCFVAGVNRIGIDGHGVAHQGDSAVIDYKGRQVTTMVPNIKGINTVGLRLSDLISFRRNFTVGMDWDQFEIIG